jgi:hypothetical protein
MCSNPDWLTRPYCIIYPELIFRCSQFNLYCFTVYCFTDLTESAGPKTIESRIMNPDMIELRSGSQMHSESVKMPLKKHNPGKGRTRFNLL